MSIKRVKISLSTKTEEICFLQFCKSFEERNEVNFLMYLRKCADEYTNGENALHEGGLENPHSSESGKVLG